MSRDIITFLQKWTVRYVQKFLNGGASGPTLNHNHDASNIVSGQMADARIAESNVTQHQAALALAASQITSGTFADARISETSVTQHEGALSILQSQITVDGNIDLRNNNLTDSLNNIDGFLSFTSAALQYEDSLAILEIQSTGGGLTNDPFIRLNFFNTTPAARVGAILSADVIDNTASLEDVGFFISTLNGGSLLESFRITPDGNVNAPNGELQEGGTRVVKAGASITDNAIVRGDGGVNGVQHASGVTIDDSNNLKTVGKVWIENNNDADIFTTPGDTGLASTESPPLTIGGTFGQRALIFDNNEIMCVLWDQITGLTLTFDATAGTITRSSGSWITDGIEEDMSIHFEGTASNDGVAYFISSVTATVITVDSPTVQASEGPTASVTATYGDMQAIFMQDYGGELFLHDFATGVGNIFGMAHYNGDKAGGGSNHILRAKSVEATYDGIEWVPTIGGTGEQTSDQFGYDFDAGHWFFGAEDVKLGGTSGQNIITEYRVPIVAEESAPLDTATASGFQWSMGNGANGSGVQSIIQVPTGWECHAVGITLKIGGGTATVDLTLNGSAQGSGYQAIISSGTTVSTEFGTPLSISDGDGIGFQTTAAASGAGPNVVTAWLRFRTTA